MDKYRKKPVVIEAYRFSGSSTDVHIFGEWMKGGEFRPAQIHTRDIRPLFIDTLEGLMRADPGDYVIKGVKGEFYPCKPDIFAATHERVED